jgi:O-succinylbenzoate synthase
LLPDLSASDRYYAQDLTAPFVLRDGGLDVPTGPGIGAEPLPDVLGSLGARTERIERGPRPG